MDYLTKTIDRKSLRVLAKIFREIFEVSQNEYFPVLDALELMPNKMPGVVIKIVADKNRCCRYYKFIGSIYKEYANLYRYKWIHT